LDGDVGAVCEAEDLVEGGAALAFLDDQLVEFAAVSAEGGDHGVDAVEPLAGGAGVGDCDGDVIVLVAVVLEGAPVLVA
jgi:hypothetical protein